jgi:hypothetical protein
MKDTVFAQFFVQLHHADAGPDGDAAVAAPANADGRFSEFGHLDVLPVLLGDRDRGELELLACPLDPLGGDDVDPTLLDTLEAVPQL